VIVNNTGKFVLRDSLEAVKASEFLIASAEVELSRAKLNYSDAAALLDARRSQAKDAAVKNACALNSYYEAFDEFAIGILSGMRECRKVEIPSRGDCTVLRVHLRGCGPSSKPRSLYTITVMTDDGIEFVIDADEYSRLREEEEGAL